MTEQSFYLSLNQAAKKTGKSKSVIFSSIKSGKLSAGKSEKGNYQIDPVELSRVFPERVQEGKKEQNRTHEKNTGNSFEIRELELKLELSDKEKSLLKDQITNYEKQLEKSEVEREVWKEQAQKLLLTHQPQKAEEHIKTSHISLAILGIIALLIGIVLYLLLGRV